MNEQEFCENLEELLLSSEQEYVFIDSEIESVLSFKDVGLLTTNKGLIVRLSNGDEFQLTVVQSEYSQE